MMMKIQKEEKGWIQKAIVQKGKGKKGKINEQDQEKKRDRARNTYME